MGVARAIFADDDTVNYPLYRHFESTSLALQCIMEAVAGPQARSRVNSFLEDFAKL